MADPTTAQRKQFAKMGIAMPDGTYYIRNASDLDNAIKAVGRGDASHDAIRKHCIERANALGLSKMIPDTWNTDGSLKHDAWIIDVEEYLAHFGVKGMHWGVRKDRSTSGSGTSHPTSSDHARTEAIRAKVNAHGVASLDNSELQHLITRLNLESQHGRLNPEQVSAGKRLADELLKVGTRVAKSTAEDFIKSYAAKGIKSLVNNSG